MAVACILTIGNLDRLSTGAGSNVVYNSGVNMTQLAAQYGGRQINMHYLLSWHTTTVFNEHGANVLVFLHGMPSGRSPDFEKYYQLVQQYVSMGFAVVIPQDGYGAGITLVEVMRAGGWGKSVVSTVINSFAGNRPISVVGHSLGGLAMCFVAKHFSGIKAFVAMHPSWNLFAGGMKGPILFTTGTEDDGTWHSLTTPSRAWGLYNGGASHPPKALINVKGNAHDAPYEAPAFGGTELTATKKWLACYALDEQAACQWIQNTMCLDPTLEWCYRELQ